MLSLLGYIYGKVVELRNALYDRGVFEVYELGVRVISVGNLSAGGTGKTPLVAYIARILADRGETVCILTRGYGRKNPNKRVLVTDGKSILADVENAGDEPFEIANRLLGKAIIIADADRVSAGEWARRRFGVTVFILDDGFQHRKVKRDLDIICIDATQPFVAGKMLPAGRLREPLDGLKRAGAVVITRRDLVEQISNLRSEISHLNSALPTFIAQNKIVGITRLIEFPTDFRHTASIENDWSEVRSEGRISEDDEVRLLAFCALGNSEGFFLSLMATFDEMDELDLVITEKFPDHHRYTQKDIHALEKRAKESKVDAFLTTAKDAVKLSNLKFDMPCFVVEIDTVIDDQETFKKLL